MEIGSSGILPLSETHAAREISYPTLIAQLLGWTKLVRKGTFVTRHVPDADWPFLSTLGHVPTTSEAIMTAVDKLLD
jgi:hypothetical protein